jgi:hypothetical protein
VAGQSARLGRTDGQRFIGGRTPSPGGCDRTEPCSPRRCVAVPPRQRQHGAEGCRKPRRTRIRGRLPCASRERQEKPQRRVEPRNVPSRDSLHRFGFRSESCGTTGTIEIRTHCARNAGGEERSGHRTSLVAELANGRGMVTAFRTPRPFSSPTSLTICMRAIRLFTWRRLHFGVQWRNSWLGRPAAAFMSGYDLGGSEQSVTATRRCASPPAGSA